jgi:hypothetical protein
MTVITQAQENAMADSRASSRQYGQDKRHPFLINIDDGNLIPNTATLRKQRLGKGKYVVYTGDAKASLDERMAYLASSLRGLGRTRVIDSTVTQEPPFDVGTCSKDDLLAFAANEYGVVLDRTKPLDVLRKQFMDTVKRLEAPAAAATEDVS